MSSPGDGDSGPIARKLAVVVGARGQDGSYLVEHLQSIGYEVFGISRGASFRGDMALPAVDILDAVEVSALIASLQPARVFHLAAYHHSSEAPQLDPADLVRRSLEVNVNSLLNFLDAIRQHSRGTRLFYAASSRIFGDPPSSPQTEATPIAPNCPYGISKAAGLGLCRLYRKEFGVFASVGILYNHESSRRSPSFVTRRLVRDAIAVKRGSRNRIEIGDSQAVVDWGYAPDFVDAFRRIMDLSEPDDFIIATGTPHTVAELVAEVLKAVELNSDVPVIEGRSGVKARRPPYPIVGDSRKLRAATGWRPTRSLAEIVRIMVNEELSHDAAPH